MLDLVLDVVLGVLRVGDQQLCDPLVVQEVLLDPVFEVGPQFAPLLALRLLIPSVWLFLTVTVVHLPPLSLSSNN